MKTLHIFLFIFLFTPIIVFTQNTQWAKQISGVNDDEIPIGMQVDSQGNIILLGYSNSTVDFDPSESTFELSSNTYTPFIAKYSSDGALIWAGQIDCTYDDWSEASALCLDENDNIYITGTFTGTIDFDLSFDNYELSSEGSYDDMFVLKLNNNGEFQWVKAFGGDYSGTVYPKDIAVKNNEIYITGFFDYKIRLDPNHSDYQYESVGDDDIFLIQLNLDGNYVWSYANGSEDEDRALSVTVSDEGNVFITGYHKATMDFAPGSYLEEVSGDGSFVVKYGKSSETTTDDTRICWWAKSFDGTNGAMPFATNIVVDTDENLYLAGTYYNSIELTTEIILPSSGELDVFVIKMNELGAYEWAIKPYEWSSPNDKEVLDLSLDHKNKVYLCGYMGSSDFFRKLDSDGTIIYAGSYWASSAYGIASADNNTFYVVGSFDAPTDFNYGEENQIDLTPAGYYDIFFTKEDTDEDVTTIAKSSDNTALSVYPIPAKNNITLIGLPESFSLQILSLDGRVVFQAENIKNIDVSNWQPGLYIIHVKTQNGTVSQQIIIE